MRNINQLSLLFTIAATSFLAHGLEWPLSLKTGTVTTIFDKDLNRKVLRYLVGGNGDQSSSTSPSSQSPGLSEQDIESKYFLMVATDQGGVYTFSPRSIDLSWNLFETF
jgi:hypothetical protein